jgi:hypothetical protein
MAKGNLESTFQNAFGTTLSETPVEGNTKGNSCPQFSKPHDTGKDTIPVVFDVDVKGRDYRGPVDTQAADILSGPMGGR